MPAVAGTEAAIALLCVVISSLLVLSHPTGVIGLAGRSPGWRHDDLSPSRFPSGYDRPKPLTVAGAALVLGPDMGHPHQIPVSVPNALHPTNTLPRYLCLA